MTDREPLQVALNAIAAGRWQAAVRELEMLPSGSVGPEELEALGRAQWWAGDVRASQRTRERAFAAYRDRGDRAGAVMVAVDICVVWLTNFENGSAARGWLARARREAGSDEDNLSAWLDIVEAYSGVVADESLRLLTGALAAGRRHGDRDLELVALADLGLAGVLAGRVDEGLRMLDEALAGVVGRDFARLETFVWTTCNMLAACALVGDQKRAAEWCAAADDFMKTYGCPFLQARCRSHYGSLLLGCGRWSEAESELESALTMSSDVGSAPLVEAVGALAELRLRQGRLGEAERLLAGLDDPVAVGGTWARVQLAAGRAARAVAILKASLERQGGAGPPTHPLAAVLVEALLACRRDVEARVASDRLARDVQEGRYPHAVALASRAAGLVACAVDDLPAGRGHLVRATAAFVALDLPFEAARTRLDLARVVELVDPDEAIAEATAALNVFRRLGASAEAADAYALLRRLGVRTPPGARSLEVLTTREQQVLSLLETGLTNPQIAERLYLSRKTVAHHVSSILSKLGLASRSEAAAWAARARS